MRKATVIALALLALASVEPALGNRNGTGSPAILKGEAECHVWVEVVASIAVGCPDAHVNAGQVTGSMPFDVTATFRVDANTQEVSMYVIATHLYKADTGDADTKIDVSRSDDVLVQPEIGNELNQNGVGFDNMLAWLPGEVDYPDPSDPAASPLKALQSEIGDFQSGQAGHFSQAVDVTVTYFADDAELTKGEYSGYIKLVATIQP
jgi:hypothetical protein